MAVPVAMPVVSRDCPAYSNDDFDGAFPAAHANNSVYAGTNYWRCEAAPLTNANSGTLSQAFAFTTPFPVYLAYDLSGAAPLGNCVVAWYNDPSTGAWDYTQISAVPNNIPRDYTIDVNAAAGGSLPGSGWTTVATVTNNVYHSRQHLINMSGKNWVRIRVTAINGSASNNNCALNMDVHSAASNQDNWAIFGDSITQQGWLHSPDPTIPAQINALVPSNFPLMEDGGLAGWLSTTAQPFLSTWLALGTWHYVGLLYGVNDANNASPGDPNFGPAFSTAMTSMINSIIAAGAIPVLPKTITWGKTTNLQANGPEINTRLATLQSTYAGQIVVGPDLWAYFQAHTSLIVDADVHPTLPDGYAAYQAQWVNSLVASVYTASGKTFAFSRRRSFL